MTNKIEFCSDKQKRFEWSKKFVKSGDKVTFLTKDEFNRLNKILTEKYSESIYWESYLNDYTIYTCTACEVIHNLSKEYRVIKTYESEEFSVQGDEHGFLFSADIIKTLNGKPIWPEELLKEISNVEDNK